MTIDYVAILQQIIIQEEDTRNRPWDDIVRQYSMNLINNSL